MKKIVKGGLIVFAVIIVAVCAWFVGYHNRKSQDNFPALEDVAKMDEADVNNLLIGYRNYQLEDVWGEPDEVDSADNTWVWNIDKHSMLYVSSNDKDKIVVCGIHAIFQAEIVEICDGYYLVHPKDESPELNSSDLIEVTMEHLGSSLEPEVGDTIEIIYSGEILETYPARIKDVYSISVITEAESEQWDRIPMVMIDGVLYLDTGFESNAEARCGVMDGEIKTTVTGSEQPTKNDQSNFGSGYSYQYGSIDGTIEIYMNDQWRVFATEEVRREYSFRKKK